MAVRKSAVNRYRGENVGCSCLHPVKQASLTTSKLLFWPFPPVLPTGGMWPCNGSLDRGRDPRERELLREMRQLKPNDVGDVSSQLRRVLSRPTPPGTSMPADGIERPEVLVKSRNDVLRDEPPAF